MFGRMDLFSWSWIWRLGFALAILVPFAPPALAEVRLVASGDLVAVLDGGEVRIHTGDGRLVTRLTSSTPPPAGTTADGEAEERREQIFELFDVPTELRDSQEAEDLIEDELTLAQRRRPSGAPPDGEGPDDRRAWAAADGAGGLWLALGGRLLRVGPGRAPVRIGSVPGPVRAMAADDTGTLVVSTPSRLLASGDGGRTFRLLVRLDQGASHLAVDPRGRWIAWADGAGLHLLGRSGRASVPVDGRVRDLQSCGGHFVLLADAGLYVGPEGGEPAAVAGPLPAQRVVCPRAGSGAWLAAGEGLLESWDHGRSFRSRLDAPAGPVVSAALTRDRIWVVTPAGIRTLAATPPAGPAPVPEPPPEEDPYLSVRPLPRWAAAVLPRLTVAASYDRTARRRDWRALAVAEVPLGGPDARLRAAPVFGRRLALAQPAPAEQALPPLPDPASGVAPAPPSPPPPTYPPSAPARAPYPPPDPDAVCLAHVRVRAVARAQAEAERARSLVGRAGHAAWLPELRLRAEKRMGRSESLDVRGSASTPVRDALGLDASNDVRYEVRATWDLPRLIFSPEEVAAVQQALRMADMRREIEAQVNRVYFERRRLLVNPAAHPAVEDTGALLRVEELEAELDAVSAGEFSRCRGVGATRLGQ
jgi:hypothetical protein